ncbi:MAG: hypothetical protein CL955_06835 [Erythrobacteraceae bacterium]|nr:hypothetical protein [Erythrobacteraceae bacterium]
MIGALRVMLGMDTAEFEKGSDKAQREMRRLERRFQQVGKNFQKVGVGLTASITAPILGAAAAFVKSADTMARESREIATSAQVAGEGFEEFQRQAFAASSVGIEFEKLGDQFKDVRERVGEFVTTGAGPLQDAFDALNGKVKLTVDELRGLSGKDALQLIVNRMEQAQLSTEEMSFVLESLASDTTNLIPLLRDGGKAFDELGKRATVISDEDREKFNQYVLAQERLGEATKALTIALVGSGLIDAMVKVVELVADFAQRASQFSPELVQIGVGFAALAAAVGPVLVALGSVITIAPAIAGAFAAIAAAAGPITAVVAGVAAAGYLIYQNWDKIAPVLERVRDRMIEVLGPKIQNLISTVSTTLTQLWEGPFGDLMRNVGAKLLPEFARSFEVMVDVVTRVAGVLIEVVSTVFEQIGNTLTFFSQLLTGDFSGAWQTVLKMVDTTVRGMLRVIEAVFPEINGYLTKLYTEAKRWLLERLGAVFDDVGKRIRQVTGFFEDMYIAVVGNSYVPDMVDEIGQEFNRLDAVMVDPARKATASVTEAAREMASDVRALLDQLFPEIADMRQKMADLKLLDGAGLSDNVLAEARVRLLGGRDRQEVGFLTGPLEEADQVAEAGQRLVEATEEAARKTETQTVRIAKSFGDMAQESIRALDQLVNAIKGGGFFDIVSGLLGFGLQLGSAGVFGKSFASSINSSGLPGFASGGSMTLGGFGGIDTNLLSLNGTPLAKVSRGETMSIRPANDTGGELNVVVTMDESTGRLGAFVEDRAGRVVAQAAGPIAQQGAGLALDQMRRANARRLA